MALNSFKTSNSNLLEIHSNFFYYNGNSSDFVIGFMPIFRLPRIFEISTDKLFKFPAISTGCLLNSTFFTFSFVALSSEFRICVVYIDMLLSSTRSLYLTRSRYSTRSREEKKQGDVDEDSTSFIARGICLAK